MQLDPYLAQFLDTTIDGAFLTDSKGTIICVNEFGRELFGYDDLELIGVNIKQLTPPDIRKEHDGFLASFDAEKGVSHVLGKFRHLQAEKKDGTLFPVEVGISHFEKDGERFFIGLIRDQTERFEALEKIRFLATHDPLTGLANRTCFLERSAQQTRQSVAALELVGFKALGLRLGNTLADQLICAVADRLRAIAVNGLILARLDHSSFALCTPGQVDPFDLSEKIKDAFKDSFEAGGQELNLNYNVGIASDTDDHVCQLDLLNQAEIALTQARQNPDTPYSLFDVTLLEEQERQTEIAKEIPVALKNGEFKLVFQPKLRQSDREVIGAEVLIRWPNSKFGFVSPAEFIPVAEKSGLISMLDGWVFSEAVKYLKELSERGHHDLELAVNVSALNLHDPHLSDKMAKVFDKYDLPCHRIQVELTESALLEDADLTIEMLGKIEKMGCPIAVDDFGTGYSSLSYLAKMPLTYLKVDQSFVSKIPEDEKSGTIAKSIISMAHSLGLKTIVEGVETADQVAFMANEDADVFQGYYFSRPLDKEDFENFLREHEGQTGVADQINRYG